VERVEAARLDVIEHDECGNATGRREIGFDLAMLLPAFRGIDAIRGIEGLTNPCGFVLIDKLQRNPAFANIWAVGVCVAIAPIEATPIPTGVPKTGYMIESMVRAVALNLRAVLDGDTPTAEATWNAICVADMGDTGIAFVAMPEIPPRNVAWIAEGR
jgi:sulfide:quinone oxidoreductase